jgi:hypothetical protein
MTAGKLSTTGTGTVDEMFASSPSELGNPSPRGAGLSTGQHTA